MEKARLFFQFIGIGIFVISLIIVGCTKEGPEGPAGEDGTDGVDGQDGTATCATCHGADDFLNTTTKQFEHATHYMMGSTGYAGTRNDCSGCHSHEGAGYSFKLGEHTTSDMIAVENPGDFECRTCHNIHNAYDETDFAPRGPESIEFITDPNIVYAKEGNNNCVSCHQTKYDIPPEGSENYEVFTIHWGAHHSSQGNIRAYIAYKIPGDATYPTEHAHDGGSCISCHMAQSEIVGAARGGHTFKVSTPILSTEGEWEGIQDINMNACNACHDDETSLISKTESLKNELDALNHELELELIRIGVIEGGHIHTGIFPANVAGLYYNWHFYHEDHSGGIHNPGFLRVVLLNSIQAAKTYADGEFASAG